MQSHDLQRTAEQELDAQAPQDMDEEVEAQKLVLQERVQQRTADQGDVSARVQLVSQETVQQRTGGDVLVPQGTPLERFSERIVEQTVDLGPQEQLQKRTIEQNAVDIPFPHGVEELEEVFRPGDYV